MKFSLYLIDDGSTDQSPQMIKELQISSPEIVLYTKTNEGHGKAIMFGYHQAVQSGADWIFQLDSDSQFLAEDFSKIWDRRSESSFILGKREKRQDPFIRKGLSFVLKTLAKIFFFSQAEDINIPFRLMRSNLLTELLKEIPASSLTPNIHLTLLADSLDIPSLNIPVTHRARQGGVPSLCTKKLLQLCCYSLLDFILLKVFMSQKVGRLKNILSKVTHG